MNKQSLPITVSNPPPSVPGLTVTYSLKVLLSPTIKSVFAPGDNPSNGTGSLKTFYNPTEEVEGFATHSEFRPYVTTIGLYNDQNDLLVVGKLGRPIKNDDDLSLKFIVRLILS